MRTVQTFILRLLVDPAEPDVLRGALQPVPEGEAQPFADAESLLSLLSQMTSSAIELRQDYHENSNVDDENHTEGGWA